MQWFTSSLNALVLRSNRATLTAHHLLECHFLLKDLLGEDEGEPSTSSCPPMKDWTAPQRFRVVRRFKQSTSNIGTNQYPQLGIYGVTESDFRGPCRNPWNLEHTPGDHLVVRRCCRRSYGTGDGGDGGGSIRIPLPIVVWGRLQSL